MNNYKTLTTTELTKIEGGCDKKVCYRWEAPFYTQPYCDNYLPAYPGKLFPQC